MNRTPRVWVVRGRRVHEPEPQWSAPPGWMVARRRPHQNLYEMYFQEHLVGALVRLQDGWAWETSVRGRAGRDKPRTSATVFETWQAAAARLATTSLALAASRGRGGPKRDQWAPALSARDAGPWEPKPLALPAPASPVHPSTREA